MRILVTGGTGVIGAGVIPELLRRGHSVRLLSRHADDDARQWQRVEAFSGDVADAQSLRGAAGACDAVIHIAGIASENPPERTFERVNAGGIRNIIDEAKRSNVRRFLYVSSLGADTGSSTYHRSKFAAEDLVERSGFEWTIVRPDAVYGPRDEVISTILKMVRALPAIPIVDDGEQRFQPLWYEDLGRALVTLVESNDRLGRTCEIAGSETTSLKDLIDRFSEITGRKPLRIPVPMPLASIGAKIASLAVDVPVDDVKLAMLHENNVLSDPSSHPLADLGIEETPLDQGLRMLASSVPEQLPEEGVGSMEHKRFWADISGSRVPATALIAHFRNHVNDVMPIEFAAEPGAPTRVALGATMTGHLPIRGNIQIRVERDEPTRITFATVEGHPIAGIVEFTAMDLPGGRVRFAVEVFARAANLFDLIAMRTAGDPAQSANWRTVVQRIIDASGGTSDGVQQETRILSEEDAADIEKSVRSIVQERRRDESAAAERPA